ncbi:translesion DNA synthesis-associated protein ImuA [Thaumasiovibrio subtropicus]|uniref:translesion DNA synthesis-associated protein ImuA n=1 Tax=Thaumasiovibrio subtropicus TaxID=1891207 RepID=UPI000B35EC60|nr:translesion DNA synthesis-associated protein ImuA [Thaumasiovibrio subtropicus]
MHELIEQLQNQHLVWHGSEQPCVKAVQQTGYTVLDNQLAGGFPRHGVVEICTSLGIGELRLLQTFLSKHQQRLIVFIAPPGHVNAAYLASQGIATEQVVIIYPTSTNDALWAAEQCLKSGACAAVMLWLENMEIHQVKRLQLASETGDCLQFLFRPKQDYGMSLPVSLSLGLAPHEQGIAVEIRKRKGGWSQGEFVVDMTAQVPALTVAPRHSDVIPFPIAQRG